MGLAIFFSLAAIELQDRLLMWFFCPDQVSTTLIGNALSFLEQEKVPPNFQVLAGLLTWWLGGVGVEGEASSFLLKLDPKRVARTDNSILLFHLKLNQKRVERTDDSRRLLVCLRPWPPRTSPSTRAGCRRWQGWK